MSYAMLSKEIEEKTNELRKIRGEELSGMDIEELQKLEKELEVGLSRVIGERFLEEITALKQKISALELKFIWFQCITVSYFSDDPLHNDIMGAELMEENQRLEQMENLFSTQTHVIEQGQSFELITNIYNSFDPQDNDSSDISLMLGFGLPLQRRLASVAVDGQNPTHPRKEWSDTEKGFGRLVSAIGVNHFKGVLDDGEGEWDRVLLELIRVWVLDDGEGLWP
uniref:K-box domain-containing protein n=1 Tax=Quercus lobata TaxID=97700 RepID=A0A7N2MXW2_QUELO